MEPLQPVWDDLKSLLRMNAEAVRGYHRAGIAITLPEMSDRMLELRDDHGRHAASLTALLQQNQCAPPVVDMAAGGPLAEPFKDVPDGVDVLDALQAMDYNEELIWRLCLKILKAGPPPDVAGLISQLLQTEAGHLESIRRELADVLGRVPGWQIPVHPDGAGTPRRS